MPPLIAGARYGHTNVIARDWRALAGFYERVFGCVPAGYRDYAGAALEAGTAVPGAALQGVHLRLPGLGAVERGPTLEIFTYTENVAAVPPPANRLGFGHIAFAVDDVAAAREIVLREGGSAVGDVVQHVTPDRRRVTWCYVRDPEGNLVELAASTDPLPD